MGIYQVNSFRGGLSDWEDKGIAGSFKLGYNLDIRKRHDTLSAGQALIEKGVTNVAPSASISPSASASPSASPSPSPSNSPSPSASSSASLSPSGSPSASVSPSGSVSPSTSLSPSHSTSPSPSPAPGTKRLFQDLIITFVKCSDGNTYGFGNSGKVYKRNPDSYWMQVYDLRKKITGACEKPSATGKIYLVFMTRTEIHRKEIPGRDDWNDVDLPGTVQGDSFPKTNLDDEDWHMATQVGGDVLIGNGSKLAMCAYDDSYTNEALDLIPGNIAKTILERNGRAVVGTCRASDPYKGVNGAVDAEVPLIQVGDDGYIYYADFKTSIAVKRLPGGGKVNPGGMVNEVSQVNVFDWQQTALSWIDKQPVGNMALLGVYGATTLMGGIYTYGRRDKNHPFALNLEYLYDADEIGAVCNTGGVTMFSYRIAGNYGVMEVDPNNKATAMWSGLHFGAPVKYTIQITQWKQAELLMKPLPAGTTVQFWYKLNDMDPYIQAYTADGQSAYTTTDGRIAVFRIAASGQIFEPRIVLTPNGNDTPEIYRVRVLFT